ncbi:MAG: PilZ domain-containing protein [Rhodospirillales bacterium]|nr:PilZ domain-containing protein [Rhodospirillales bacterium]
MRKHERSTVDKRVHINDGQPFTGRLLNDISVGGVSVVYPSEASPTGKPLETG